MTRSYSIGTASRGYLIGAKAMRPDHACLKIRPVAKKRRAYYGTMELVSALETVACNVARTWPGSVLLAGDLSSVHGGDLPGHASHNSGRDADITFYMRDQAGRIDPSPRMLPIRPDGQSRWGQKVFDIPRNWAFVDELLRQPKIQVQYLLVANHIRKLLLSHAHAIGADPQLIRRAKAVLRQPRDSSIHEEHFHLRIYCGLQERLAGCVDFGPVHPWIQRYDKEVVARVREVVPFLRHGGDEEIRFAITRIVRLRARVAIDHLGALTSHKNPEIAKLATDAVAFLQGKRTPPAWAHLTEEDPGE